MSRKGGSSMNARPAEEPKEDQPYEDNSEGSMASGMTSSTSAASIASNQSLGSQGSGPTPPSPKPQAVVVSPGGTHYNTQFDPNASCTSTSASSINEASRKGSVESGTGSQVQTPDEDQDAVISDLVGRNQALIEAIARANSELDAANESNLQRYKELKKAQDLKKNEAFSE